MKPKPYLRLLFVSIFLTGCNLTAQTPETQVPTSPVPITVEPPTPLPTSPVETAATAAPPTTVPPATDAPPTAAPTAAPTPTTGVTPTTGATTAATPISPDVPAEVIQIDSPGPGSRLVSPIRLSGEADPTFEQSLAVTIVLADGTELTTVPTQIGADVGQRGPFEVEIPFTISGEEQAFIQVYTTSARDGGITHLASVGVLLADSGAEEIRPVDSSQEKITIFSPALNAAISGGSVLIEGFGLASFEQTLLAEVIDQNGSVVGSQPLIVNAPDLGLPGPFQVEVPYTVSASGPGRIVVRDVSPAFGGTTHLASVEINLEP